MPASASFSDRIPYNQLRQRPPRKRNQHKLTSGKERELAVKFLSQVL